MKTFRNPYFIASVILYLLAKGLQKAGIHIPLIHSWLNDVLCLPVILGITLAFQRTVTYRNPGYVFRPGHIIFTVVYVSVVFEVMAPRWSPVYTSDLWDVAAYAAGGLLFYFLINKPLPAERQVLAPERRN